jgi:hypothetical protein
VSNENTPQTVPTGIGRGEPAVDFNGTQYTSVEGSAADSNISIRRVDATFDPHRQSGIALTTTQAMTLGVRVGQTVIVHDNWQNRDVEAVYYDNAGRIGDLHHFEVSPGLADTLGLQYRNRRGQVVDGVAGSERMQGRFDIRRRPPR